MNWPTYITATRLGCESFIRVSAGHLMTSGCRSDPVPRGDFERSILEPLYSAANGAISLINFEPHRLSVFFMILGIGALFAGDFEIDRRDYEVGSGSATMSDKVKISLSVFGKGS